jgi:hypothetical protein
VQLQEVISMLRWINESDPRFPFNDSTVEKWHFALRNVEAGVAKQAVLEHVKKHDVVPMPSMIANRAGHIKASREAGQRAIEAPTPRQEVDARDGKLLLSWRKRDPERWAALMEQGRLDREADLRARGRL